MRIAMFYHSLYSDWNHGNAHFLRGVASELLVRGHEVRIYEPENGWSFRNLIVEGGKRALDGFRSVYPELKSVQYDLGSLDLDSELDGVDLVIVHEWNDPVLVESLGKHRRRTGAYVLLFHDTHHRALTDRE